MDKTQEFLEYLEKVENKHLEIIEKTVDETVLSDHEISLLSLREIRKKFIEINCK